MSLETFLSRRYLSSQRGRGLSVITWIALLGVIVGVMSLVTVLAVMSGFEKELREKILGNNAHIFVTIGRPIQGEKRALPALVSAIEKVEGVSAVMPVIYGDGFLLSPTGESDGVRLRGVDRERVQRVLDLKKYVKEGEWGRLEGSGAILGETLARRLDLRIGDEFTLLLNRGEFSPLGLVPKMKKLRLVDTFHSGMTQFDGHHGYLALATASQIFETEPRALEIRTKDVRQIEEVRERIRLQIPEAILVEDWISQNKDFLSALRLEKLVMAIILALIVLVASFNICGSLIMVVKDKTRDIAILKSMGATDTSILKIFFFQGVFIGLVGTAVGSLLGFILSFILRDYIRYPLNQEVYMIDTLPVDIQFSDIALVGLGALVIAALATLYPAWLASRVVPTEGLKAD